MVYIVSLKDGKSTQEDEMHFGVKCKNLWKKIFWFEPKYLLFLEFTVVATFYKA